MHTHIGFAALALLTAAATAHAAKPPPWQGYAGNAQHTAKSPASTQALHRVRWHTPVDLAPQYTGNELFIHYAEPMLTAANTVLVPVKTTATGDFRMEAHAGKDGSQIWAMASDYVLPVADWPPSFPAGMGSASRVYMAGAAGTVLYRDMPDYATGKSGRYAFYGLSVYKQFTAELTQKVMIDTPITADAAGTIYFGFVVSGANSAKLQSGIARIAKNGQGSWVSAAKAAGSANISQVQMNCAPALSADGTTLYISVSNGTSGMLLALDSATLATKAKVPLTDPSSGQPAWLLDISTASPTIGPDGDVYIGVLENPFPNHNDRGWLLHFDATLATQKIPGSFGWDDTASIVPASAVPSYTGTSSYLLLTKYNNYLGIGSGDGQNKIAVLDPNAEQRDEYSQIQVQVMQEVLTLLGPTPAPGGGVYEWCINSAAVDAKTRSVFAGSEDGNFYRWNLNKSAITQKLSLNPPTPEAYTPSLSGPDGTVYAINNATLFATGP